MKIATIGERGSLLKDKYGRLKATVSVNGKQYQKRVKSEAEGRQFVLSVELERDNRDELSAKQLNDASNALHLLRKQKVDVSFVDLVRYYLDNAFEGIVTVEEAVAEYLKKCEARITEGTLHNYKRFLRLFCAKFAQRKVASIKQKEMMDYLTVYEKQPSNWLNAQRALSKFFVECQKYGYCSSNPCHLLEAPRNCKAPSRKYLSPEDAMKVLRCAEEMKRKDMVLYLALGLFGGLRPSEAFRMSSKHINLETGYIYISADITKTHAYKERTFQIEPTLMAWLRRYYDPSQPKPIHYKSINTLSTAVGTVFAKAGVERSDDVLRHSFGTYRFALSGNSAETAFVMGHSESVGNSYYRGRAPKDEAIRFFAIRPKEDTAVDLDSL